MKRDGFTLVLDTLLVVFLDLCKMIKIEHSIFALPYAWAGSCLAAKGLPSLKNFVLLTLAMIAVRSFAMTFNRIADLSYDRRNPRTQDRPLVTGRISVAEAWIFCILMAGIFVACCYGINRLCLWLSVPALAVAAAYSLLKRLTPLCHFWLGGTLGLAPLAGWISVNPASIGLAPILLSLSVLFWVAAFDIYYSFQDIDFDRNNLLHSMPADFGRNTALAIAGFAHALTGIFLLLTGLAAGLSIYWFIICLAIAALLIAEHKIMLQGDLASVNTAFFTLNGIISPVMLAGILIGIYC